jgi:DnaJ-class molecular chaperone
MVLKGRGVSYLNSAGKGDLFVRFFLQLPRYVGKFSPFSLNLKYIQDLDQASASSPRGLC